MSGYGDEGPGWYDMEHRCRDCEMLLTPEEVPSGYCTICVRPPLTVTERLRWIRSSTGLSMLESLRVLIDSASEHGHILCNGAYHPIPQSSYRPRKGDL